MTSGLFSKIKLVLPAFLFFICLDLIPVSKVKAADQTITCSASGCSGFSGALFNETNMAPGYSVTKTFAVDNTDNSDNCSLFMSAQNTTAPDQFANFPTRLITVINDGVNDLFGDGTGVNPKNFSDLFSQGNIFLGTVPANGNKSYNWFVNFNKDSGNTYQNNNLTFSFSLNFSCGNKPAPTPAISNGGGTLGAASAPVCTDTAPAGAPVLLSAKTNGGNSVTLTWTPAPDPVTYYLITYGTTPGAQTYGNPNIGGHSTTSYTVNGLSGGTTYYFRIRAGNGCMPGPYSNELSVISVGRILAGPAVGFAPGVLGTATQPGITPSPKAQVLGTECIKSKFPWWIFLVLELTAVLLILRREKINKWRVRKSIFWFIVIAVLSQIIHEATGCNCITSVWCSKYLWINLAILLFSTAYALYRSGKKNK